MDRFVGRTEQLNFLSARLEEAKASRGVLMSIRGRRQIGKSRLVEEFLARTRANAIFFTASRQGAERELALFHEAIAASQLPIAELAASGGLGYWEATFSLLGGQATRGEPLVVVLDEFPYLIESDPAIEGTVQKVWDRDLQDRPVLMILVGSDLTMMAALSEYGRPLYGRVRELVVPPLSPPEIGELLGLDAAPLLDAYLVIGGFPRLATLWPRRRSMWEFLRQELDDSSSPLIVAGERSLNAEFPTEAQARAVLTAIGAGERAYAAIGSRSGIGGRSLDRALELLQEKRIVERSLPYSARPSSKAPRYTIIDPYLRFWLRFLGDAVHLIDRGRGDLVLERIRNGWVDFRGKAVEPLVRSAIERLLPDERFGSARFVGSFWTRDNRIEVDLVGGRGPETAERVDFVGSIKWRERAPFKRADLRALARRAEEIPGASPATPLVAVSRAGFEETGAEVELGSTDLLAGWTAASRAVEAPTP